MLPNTFQVGTIRAYEVLKGLTGGTGNRLDALLALLEPEFAERDGQILEINEFVLAINRSMKLALTSDALMDFLPYAVQKGLVLDVTTDKTEPKFKVTCHKPSIPNPRSVEILKTASEEFERFLTERDISNKRFPRDNEYLANCLIEWLISIDTTDAISIAESISKFDNGSDQVQYLCARFVKSLIDANSSMISDLQLISDVGLLSDLINEFKKPINEVKQTTVTIILDSPILLEVIGVSGRSSEESTKHIFNILKRRGARFFYLPQTLAEMRRSLKTMLDLPASGRYGQTHAAIQRGEIDELFVRAIYANAAQVLNELGIPQIPVSLLRDANSERMVGHQAVDKLANDLDSVYNSQNHGRARARHDAEAVISVIRLRQGDFATDDLFQSRFFFLTRNHAFKATARAFCLRTKEGSSDGAILLPEEVGPVVDIRELASAVWARMPAENHNDMSRLALMAGCERVLRLNRRAVSKVSNLINKLSLSSPVDDDKIRKIRIAMMVPNSSQYLQDRLRGEARDISYEDILKEYAQAESDNIEKGVAKSRSNYEAEIKKLEDAVSDLDAKMEAERKAGKDLEEAARLEKEKLEQEILIALEDKKRLEQEKLDRVRRERESDCGSASNIINRATMKFAKMRRNIRMIAVALLIVVVVTKVAVEKIWLNYLTFEIYGYVIPLGIVLIIFLTMFVVVIESTFGIFGEVKIPIVRGWMEGKLEAYYRDDLEMDRLSSSDTGVTIIRDGLQLRTGVEGDTNRILGASLRDELD